MVVIGAADSLTKEYMNNPAVFADAFNMYLFHGDQVIKPESLEELDTTEVVIPYGKDGEFVHEKKYRDVLKIMKTDGKMAYSILGIENQTDIHYAMPVRNMLYDAMHLSKQVVEKAKLHRRSKDKNTKAEFLSGFHKTDTLIPVITLVIYWGADVWDGPMSLKDMYSSVNERVDKFLPEYRINLIAPEQMSEIEIDSFKTDLKEVMLYIKYSRDKEKLKEITSVDESFRHMRRETANVLNIITNSKLKIDEGEEEIDMCLAIQQMREDALLEGKTDAAIRMITKNKLSLGEIADYVALPLEDVEKLAAEVLQHI